MRETEPSRREKRLLPPRRLCSRPRRSSLTARTSGSKRPSAENSSSPFFSPRRSAWTVGLSQVLTTPRSQRFTTWGVLNDPNCTDGNAATGGLDICPPDVAANDPDAPYEGAPSGVVGVREFPNPSFNSAEPPSATNSPFLVGVACAACHAGLNAQSPPADPNHPTWANISLTTGNQFIQIGKLFGAGTCRRPTRDGRCSTPGLRGRWTRRRSRATASTTPASSRSSSSSLIGRTSRSIRTGCC